MPFRYISRRRQLIRSFYSGIGKTAVIFPSAFLAAVGQGILILGMVFYVREVFQPTGGQIGAFFGFWSAAYIGGCLILRPLTDTIRPRYLLAVSTLCMGLCILAVRCCTSFGLATVFYGCIAFAAGIFWPPLMGWLSAALEGAELSKAMSKFNFSWSVGGIISPFLAGWLTEQNVALPLYVAAAVLLGTSLLITGAALALPKVRNDRHSAAEAKRSAAGPDRSTRLRFAGWVGAFTAFVALGAILYIFPVWARNDLHMREGIIGALFSARSLFMALAFVIMGRTVFWHFRGSQMLLWQICMAGSLVAMVYAHHPAVLAPILALLGFTTGYSYFSSMFHGLAGTARRAARSAIHESLLSSGLMCGPVLGGLIYQHYSINAVYLTCAGIVLVGVGIQAGIGLWARKVEGTCPRPDE